MDNSDYIESYLHVSGQIIILTKPELIGHFEGKHVFYGLRNLEKLGWSVTENLGRQGWENTKPLRGIPGINV